MTKTAVIISTLGFIFAITGQSTAKTINDGMALTSADIVYADKCMAGEVMDEKTKKCVKK